MKKAGRGLCAGYRKSISISETRTGIYEPRSLRDISKFYLV